MDLSAIRARLAAAQGQRYWRSLEEVAETEGFREWLEREFPQGASVWNDPIGRRDFLKLMAASLALAGLGACTRPPEEKIVPYVKAPEEIIPGKPLFFASAATLGGFATGIAVESHMGRPTKIEGNSNHPASLGATTVFAQASVLGLYDPDRSQVVLQAGRISTWDAFLSALNTRLAVEQGRQGTGLRVLTETVTSPTLASQLRALLNKFPAATWHQYEPAGRDTARTGARLAFGEPVETHYRFDRAAVILALDADFLACGPASLRYASDFAARRRVVAGQAAMNRLYAVESTPSLTGAMADHRLPLRAADIESFARAVAREVEIEVEAATPLANANWIGALARDLKNHRGASVVVAGDQQPPIVHALAHAINHALGNVGRTVVYTEPVEANPVDQAQSLRELVEAMEAGRVDTLVILGGNPVYSAPADLRFAHRLSRVPFRAHLSLYEDETSTLCHWHIPEAHFLESWSDARAYDGTASIIQPLIAPLYGGRSAHELVGALLGEPGRSGHDIARDYWKDQEIAADFERFWRNALHDGFIPGTAFAEKRVTLRRVREWGGTSPSPSSSSDGLEIVFRPDPTVWDGRFANNGWLQELPKPLTKLTWDNTVMISASTAERLGLENEDVAELHFRDRAIRGPVWIMPGHADESVTVHLGYGRTRAGRVGTGAGFNAYAIRPSDTPWFVPGIKVQRTGARHPLASTQEHHSMEGRPLVRVGTLGQYREHPDFVHKMAHDAPKDLTLYPEHKYEGYAWGMTIDLNACIGCNACVVACQAENNIPIVGKDQVSRGREMHWLRIDRYYQGDIDNPETVHQPVLCMHCENAPCEVVCPVAATVHSKEGLNEMVYNRCVGTRYCSNNCPYKVRRFNFLQYEDHTTPSLKLLRNPNVTVRTVGVMEKCTYCVQRINAARIDAKKEDRPIRDGDVVTACQQACPTDAIVFGNINDPASRVSRLKTEPRNYGLLTELNTRPRTTYLARLRNPNPEIETGEA